MLAWLFLRITTWHLSSAFSQLAFLQLAISMGNRPIAFVPFRSANLHHPANIHEAQSQLIMCLQEKPISCRREWAQMIKLPNALLVELDLYCF